MSDDPSTPTYNDVVAHFEGAFDIDEIRNREPWSLDTANQRLSASLRDQEVPPK